jgi:branched-chain amino acid transport system ATP-binding protein
MSRPAVLKADDIIAGYEAGMPIVRGATIGVALGEIVVILGPNGAGKSTLIKAIVGLVSKFSGTVTLDGADITASAAHEMVRHGLAYVPQTDNVFTLMSVDDNLALAAAILPRRERQLRIEEVYVIFPDLAAQRSLPAGRLSGGQRQMLAIARALMVKPKLLVLDEASAGLSPKLVEMVFTRLKRIREAGVSLLLVEQNVRAALAIADRAYVLVDGENRYEGTAAELWHDRTVAELYLGAGPEGLRQ